MDNRNAVQQVGTLTTETSGVSATGTIQPALSNVPFKNLTIIVVPEADPSPYQVDVYFFGELVESHPYPNSADRVIANMMFPNMIFPANIGYNTIPVYFTSNREEFRGLPVYVTITNLGNEQVYKVYSIFEAFEGASFGRLTQD